ncbi:hypothetical protein RZE82_07550 [Mollicutes bacterium LVI A0039]|nr:hypothetical protein RZE82_07550 [Mollicutes bacterium LVI A0039]
MQKILLALLPVLLIVLTGCGPTAYDEFQEETLDLQNSAALSIATDFAGYESVDIEFDLANNILKIDMKEEGIVSYVVEETMYFQVGGMWAYMSFNDDDVAEMFDIFNQSATVAELLPDSKEVFDEEFFGYPLIDDAIEFKSPKNVLVKTDKNTYTIKGIEDNITLTTTDGVLNVTIKEDGQEHFISFAASESFSVPEEAKAGIDIDSLN